MVAADANRMLPSCTQAMAVEAALAAGLPLEEGHVSMDEVTRPYQVHGREAVIKSAASAASPKGFPSRDQVGR